MKNYIKNILLIGVVAIVLILCIGNFERGMDSNISLGSDAPNKLSGSATVSTGPTITTTSASVLAASGGRQWARFTNDSATVPVYLSFTGSTAAVANRGIALEPLMSFEINLGNQYVGQVNAITGSTTAVLTVTAFQ